MPKSTIMNKVEVIKTLAEAGHSGQYRFGPGHVPYIEHPKAVVELLKSWGVNDDLTLCTGWAHDLFEDTDITAEDIHEALNDDPFADSLVENVMMLTNPDEEHKAEHIAEIAAKGTQTAILVKCADRICNTRDFIEAGRINKATRYFRDGNPVYDAVLNYKAKEDIIAMRGQLFD